MIAQSYRFGACCVVPSTRQVFCNGASITLSPKAFDTLLHLIQHRDRVVTRDELLRAVWPGRVVEEANVTQAIYTLRNTLSVGVADSRLISTVARIGYRFVPPLEQHQQVTAPAQAKHTVSNAIPEKPPLERITLCAETCLEKGGAQLALRAPANLLAAVEWFRTALAIEPRSADAYAGLANSYSLLSLYGGLASAHETYPLARVAAQRALEIDDSLAAAHTALGVVQLFYDWDGAGAHESFERAIKLAPHAAEPRYRWGMCLLSLGEIDAARDQFERATQLDPLSLIIRTFASYPDYYRRRYEAAILSLRKTIQLDPKFSMAHFRLGLALTHAGRFAEAIDELSTSLELSGGEKDVIAALAYARGKSGDLHGARDALRDLTERSYGEFTSGYHLTIAHLGVGATGPALQHLERAYEQRSYWLIYAADDPALDGLRGDPGFVGLLQRIRLFARTVGNESATGTSPGAALSTPFGEQL